MNPELREIEEWAGHAPPDPGWWPGLAAILLFAIIVLIAIGCMGCTLTVSPDGTRVWQADAPAIARAIIVIAADK